MSLQSFKITNTNLKGIKKRSLRLEHLKGNNKDLELRKFLNYK